MVKIQIEDSAIELLNNPFLSLSERYDYLRILSATYGHKLYFAKQYSNDIVTHILPFTVVTNPILGKKIVSLPFDGSYGDVICIGKGDPVLELYQEVLNYAEKNGIIYIEIRTRDPNHYILSNMGFSKNISMIISEINLSQIKDNNYLHRKKRSSLHISKVKGLSVSISSDICDLKTFYKIMSINMRNYGTPMYPYAYFKNMWDEFFPKGELILIKSEYKGKMIGGLLLLFGQHTSIIKYSSALSKYFFTRPYAAMNWTAIDFCIQHGCEYLNMGTSFSNDDGLVAAKKGFGADSLPLVAYTYDYKRKTKSLMQLQKRYGFLIKMWKFQPLFTSQLLGNLFWKWFC